MKGSFYLVAKAQIKYCCARDDSISYTYDPDGLRTSKTVNGTTTKYHVMNGTLLGQTKGSDTIVFLYDEKANRYGFDYNGTKYYYIFNVQGDVIGILNQAGQKIVSYTYDPWGKVLSVDGSEASTIGQINPIRYRGYYYDTETGFYYLQSRYYDPTTRRFLNSDILVGNVGSVGQNNLFQYCSNNPVNLADPTGYLVGEIAVFLLFVAVVASIPAVIGAGASTALPSVEMPSFPVVEFPTIEVPVYNPPASGYSQSIADSVAIGGEIAAEQEQTASNDRSNPKGLTYYHATTFDNALLIIASQALIYNSPEGAYVYAWRLKPTKRAIHLSGARGTVLISFETNAAFEDDPGITNSYVLIFKPVRSVFQKRIRIWNVKLVG
ncbi:MAG: RHS repeat-associated core domain-containing protein [[Clostridium] leptum]